MSDKIPRKVLRCTTHHICDCLKWRMEHLERALKVIRTWAACEQKYGHSPDPDAVIELCDKALDGPQEREHSDS